MATYITQPGRADRRSGTSQGDTMVGADRNDQFFGLAGNDLLLGNGGDDSLHGGAGNDILRGGDGNDTLNGQEDNDDLDGGDGNDILNGGAGNDVLHTSRGSDTFLFGVGSGHDVIRSDIEHFNPNATGFGRNKAKFEGIDSFDLQSVHREGNALVLNYGAGDQLRIESQNRYTTPAIALFEFANETLTQESLLSLYSGQDGRLNDRYTQG